MSVDLSRRSWPEIPPTGATVLVPVGSTEQHGPHLPLFTDGAIADAVARRSANRLPGEVFVAPLLAFGNSGEHAGFPGTVSIGHDALRLVLIELVRSLGLWARRTVFVNGHGGNIRTLIDAVAQLRAEGHSVAWTGCDFPGSDAHAGRTETSVMLHLSPHNVSMDSAAPGNTRPLAELMPQLETSGVRSVAPNGVLGDPTGASAEEGRRLLETLVATTVDRINALETP
ncbi:mycofactocin biosynthesis peptidyl-dipeptidase MftE [Actinospica sp. MGRD01-02]|uniref:Mycofactocin biosynthesis peptidyl-dipeptidase MftE n=1 Tax=Actinospica acidithermotolerans TaxID=2828514 RepID=A0A941E865_9ACTN|nr:mycofactocin biosynthesis peptidyl-dipeptidase MftE [Actinospica acidithermotolerans]MBR7825693.1 mycofactocin biosynthesis peptidyl-dipeptidase MftE [Actinospica acidithermotolerans]